MPPVPVRRAASTRERRRASASPATALGLVLLASVVTPTIAREPVDEPAQAQSEWPTVHGVMPTFRLTHTAHAFQRTPFEIHAPGASGTVRLRDGHYAYSDTYPLDPGGGATGVMRFGHGPYNLRAHLSATNGWAHAISCPVLIEPTLRPADPRVELERSIFHVGEMARFFDKRLPTGPAA